MAERVLVLALLIALGLVVYDESRQGSLPPRPSRFIGVAAIFSVFAVVAVPAPALAAAFAIAADIALAFMGTGQASAATSFATQQAGGTPALSQIPSLRQNSTVAV